MPNHAPLVIYLTALSVNLGTNSTCLVVHLITGVVCIILVIPTVPALVSAIPLIASDKGSRIPTTAATIPLNKLIVLLNADWLMLATDRISAVERSILTIAPIKSLIATIPLVIAQKSSPIASIGYTMKELAILLVVNR